MTHTGRNKSSPASKMGAWSGTEESNSSAVDHNGSMAHNHNNNGRGGERPYSPVAETLFRKDLISAMKLPDNEPLTSEDYWIVIDTWKQDWEKGVQVPFKPEELPEPRVSRISHPPQSANRFAFPKKYMCSSRSSKVYDTETHQITPMALRSEQVCSYDLDEIDQRWLTAYNGERSLKGSATISELELESCIEHFEKQCCDKIQSTIKINEKHDEQDDSVICDVCRSPDSEECNEMVFCDKCNICVHQACYGITTIPSGPWLCRICVLGARPKCELCPNKGGAMKSTKSGQKWAHVSCALWIPEVSIGCVDKMEPITKISSIPTSRWNLTCVLCKERVGCCIQCSVKTCKTAYHVTCAFKSGLKMRAIIEDENAEDGVKLRSYCQKHSRNQKRKESEDSDSSDFRSSNKKKSLSAEDRCNARQQKIAKIECEFHVNVDISATVKKTNLDEETVDFIYRYWILKRRSNGNKRLLGQRTESPELLSSHNEESEREQLKSFVHLRQDLERVRNLCYMVSRREKLQRSFIKLREQILEKQISIVCREDESSSSGLSLMEMSAILEANHGPTIYDKIFSHAEAEPHTENDFEVIVSRISGEIADSGAYKKRDHRKSGNLKSKNDSSKSVYKRIFSDMSNSETDDFFHLTASLSSSSGGGNKKKKAKKNVSKKSTSKTSDFSCSADEDRLFNSISRKDSPKKEFKTSIYTSDSDEGRQSPVFRTKAAMKDFSLGSKKEPKKSPSSKIPAKKKKKPSTTSLFEDEDEEDDKKISDSDCYHPMIVPQRAAARKASAKMKVASIDQPKIKKKHSSLSGEDADEQVDQILQEPDIFGLVPQRKAAKKASAYLKDSDKPLSASKEEALLAAAASPPLNKKSPNKLKKKEPSVLPLSARLHLSSDSDSDLESSRPLISSKSPRRAPPKSPRKNRRPPPKKEEKKKQLSSSALAFLNQRESQLDNFLRDVGLKEEEEETKPPPLSSPEKKKETEVRSSGSSSSSSNSSNSSSSSSDSESEAGVKKSDLPLEDPLKKESSVFSPVQSPKALETPVTPPRPIVVVDNKNDNEISPIVELAREIIEGNTKSTELLSKTKQVTDEGYVSAELPAPVTEGGLQTTLPAIEEDAILPENTTSVIIPTAENSSPAVTFPPSVGTVSQDPPSSVQSLVQEPPTPDRNDPDAALDQLSSSKFTPEHHFSRPTPEHNFQHQSSKAEHQSSVVQVHQEPVPASITNQQQRSLPVHPISLDHPHQVQEQALKPTMEQQQRPIGEQQLNQTPTQQQLNQCPTPEQQAMKELVDSYNQAPDSEAKRQAAMLVQSQQYLQDQQHLPMNKDQTEIQQQNLVSQQNRLNENWSVDEQLNRHIFGRGSRAQNEALLNYICDYQRKFGYGNGNSGSQDNYTQMHQQMKSFYGSQKYSNNLDLFSQLNYQHQYQQYQQYQYMQQQMGGYEAAAAAAAASGNYQYNKKDLQAIDQIINSSRSGTSQNSWLDSQNKLAAMMQYQNHAGMPPTTSSSSIPTTQNQSMVSPAKSKPDDLQSLPGKVQSVGTRRTGKESPKRSAVSPKSSIAQLHQPTSEIFNMSGIPAATPSEKLPGYAPKPVSKSSEPALPPPKVSESKNAPDPGFSISKELLDTVAAVSKLPVWKPSSERESESGASEHTPIHSFSPGPATPKSGTNPEKLKSGGTDKTFDALVKKVEHVKDQTNTPARSESQDTSDLDRNDDYDDTKGGVDYDDLDEFDDIQSFIKSSPVPSVTKPVISSPLHSVSSSRKPKKESYITKKPKVGLPTTRHRGGNIRGSGGGTSKTKFKPITINTKALEKVHRTVAGTDYDFEDEFDDDFESVDSIKGGSRDNNGSVKKPSLPIYMQDSLQNNITTPSHPNQSKKSSFKFDDEDDFDFTPAKPLPRTKSKPVVKTNRSKNTRNSKRKTFSELNDNINGEEDDPIPKLPPTPVPKEDNPPLPKLKLKLGALMVTKKEELQNDSPPPSSVVVPKIIPKLKIKIGPKPSPTAVTAPQIPPPPAVISTSLPIIPHPDEETVEEENNSQLEKVSSGSIDESLSVQKTNVEEEYDEDECQQHPIISEESKSTSSSINASSPAKKGSLIDSLAKKLLNKQNSEDSKSDLDSIFGPPTKPLDMSVVPAPPTVTAKESVEETKSELDLLREEMATQQIKMQEEEQKPATATPVNNLPTQVPTYNPYENQHPSTNRLKHLKMKFRGIAQSAVSPPSSSSASNVPPLPILASAPDSSNPSNIRRMRKKELLNRYYGQDIYPSPAVGNGPPTSNNPPPPASEPPPTSTPAVRNIIKMPKAVASVTSVPTRADYQPQLEANLERKRKRMNDMGLGFDKNKYDDKYSSGKKKKGRGSKEDSEYKPKSVDCSKGISEEEKRENARKTRGKPPKKCLAESPPHAEPPEDDLKAQHMMYAEKIRSSFEAQEAKSSRRSKKRKKGNVSDETLPSSKAPRIVIKFSKEGSGEPKNKDGTNEILNGKEYDFTTAKEDKIYDDPSENNVVKVPKIKIKI